LLIEVGSGIARQILNKVQLNKVQCEVNSVGRVMRAPTKRIETTG